MSKTKKTLIVLVLVVMGFIGWGVYDNRERPLGEGFEYLGKKDYGCWMWFCPSPSGTIYYYATNLSESSLKKSYFKNAAYKGAESDMTVTGEEAKLIHFQSSDGDFYFTLYNKNVYPSTINLKTDKIVVGVNKNQYALMKSKIKK